MEIERLEALSDNYIFLLLDRSRHLAAVVDPATAEPVLERLHSLKYDLVAIFNTHHHRDHVGGNTDLTRHYPNARVYGGKEDRGRIPGLGVFLSDGDRVEFAGREGRVFFVPGHTRGHIAYYFSPLNPGDTGELFCGDTIFSGGCGRLFEGTPGQMLDSLSRLRSLPDDTRVWCAHEYTLNNLKFALTVEPDNGDLREYYRRVESDRSRGIPTVPTLLGREKRINPFLRWERFGNDDPLGVFTELRRSKDRF